MVDPQNGIGGASGLQTPLGGAIVPKEVQDKFPDLVPQILASPSMDNEEKKYWFSVLPIMTEDQIKELRDILKTEQNRISALQEDVKTIDIEEVEKNRRQNQEERKSTEQEEHRNDEKKAEDLLRSLNDID
ncbi:hypothetical protein IPN35_03310 [Candidatus Peregrinibacteria bacterium]|nr:MAG: hypothetical protein IPN35_03310 [Candidatus Peregrinibacteria bacterium]